MKKILSFVLVLAMIASMMCVSVSAFDNGQKGNLVGDNDNAIGVDKFTQQSNTTNVSATIKSSVINRYAVDLEYSISNITLDGESVWNVKTLEYEANNLKITIGTTTTALTTGTEQTFQIGTIKLTNYSDLGLDVGFEISMPLATSVPITGAVARTDANFEADAFDVAGAYTGKNDKDTAVVANYKATITSTDWARAAAQLNAAEKQNDGTVKIATITFSVQPATEGHREATTVQGPGTTPAAPQG